MGKVFIPIADQKTVELLQAVKEGRKSQTELVRRLRDYRRLKDALSFLASLEIEIRKALGFYQEDHIPLKIRIVNKSYGTHNGRRKRFYEKNTCVDIIDIDMEDGRAIIGVDEEVLEQDG